jgi:hypothetical protein
MLTRQYVSGTAVMVGNTVTRFGRLKFPTAALSVTVTLGDRYVVSQSSAWQ